MSALHEGMSCENGNRVCTHVEVQLPLVPPTRAIPASVDCTGATLSNCAEAQGGEVSSIGAGTRELIRPAGGVPSGFKTVTCQ